MRIVEFNKEEENITDFINLAKKLYTKPTLMEDEKTMRQLLLEKHPLSKYFKLNKFCNYKNFIQFF